MSTEEELKEINDYVYSICLFTSLAFALAEFIVFGIALYYLPGREKSADNISGGELYGKYWFTAIYEILAGI